MAAAAPPHVEFLQLVGDPQRWQLLEELGRSDRRVGELAALTGKAQNLVSYHLRELRDAGLVTARRSSADGRDTYYRLDRHRCRERFLEAAGALHTAGALPVAPGGSSARRPKVLFLCTGNSARSQMAEALVGQRSDGAVAARSAGSHPKPLHPDAVRVMAERGIDIGGHRPKHLDRFARGRFDRVVTLCDKVKEVCPDFPGDPLRIHWSMADPSTADDGYAAFVRTADELEERIDALLAELADVPPPATTRSIHAHR